MSKRSFPAVEVTLTSEFGTLATFVSYVRLTTVRGNAVVLDEYGYDLTISWDCVRPLGYDITIAIEDGKLVTTAVSA